MNLADYGFVFNDKYIGGRKMPKHGYLIRPGVAMALTKAREILPKGCNLKVYDAWRPWHLQKKAVEHTKKLIIKSHPKWSKHQVDNQLWMMAPPMRIVPRLNSHRYAGAVDLTIVDAEGTELAMGVPVDYVTGPEARLLFYELKDGLTNIEKKLRKNRRLLITAMEYGGFHPYLPEFWHWGYDLDLM